MNKKIISSFAIFITISLFVVGFPDTTNDFPKEKVNDFIHEGFDKQYRNTTLLHRETVNNGVILFYGDTEKRNYLGTRFVEKELFGWKATFDRGEFTWTSNKEGYPNHGLDSHFYPSQTNSSPFPILIGAIKKSEIKNVVVSYKDNGVEKNIEAETVKSDGEHFYFVSVPEPTSSITYKVKGYSVGGEVIENEEVQSLIVND